MAAAYSTIIVDFASALVHREDGRGHHGLLILSSSMELKRIWLSRLNGKRLIHTQEAIIGIRWRSPNPSDDWPEISNLDLKTFLKEVKSVVVRFFGRIMMELNNERISSYLKNVENLKNLKNLNG